MSVVLLAPTTTLAGDGSTTVSRTLPQRGHLGVGPWWFVDAFGGTQDDGDSDGGGSDGGGSGGGRFDGSGSAGRPPVGAPHGHAGMQSMTWLFSGALRHTDGLGADAVVRAGQVLMFTAGDGAVHTETPVGEEPARGVALGLVLPPHERHRAASVEEFWPEPVRFGDHEVAIFVGELGWEDSPVEVFSPAAGAEVRFASHDPWTVPIPERWEFGVLALDDPVWVDGIQVPPGHLALVSGQPSFDVSAQADAGTVVPALVLGGEIPEPFVPWWNFVGADHDEIASWCRDYEAARGLGDGNAARFPLPPGVTPADLIPATPLPEVRLLPKHRDR